MRRLRFLAFAIVAASGLLLGCGGGGTTEEDVGIDVVDVVGDADIAAHVDVYIDIVPDKIDKDEVPADVDVLGDVEPELEIVPDQVDVTDVEPDGEVIPDVVPDEEGEVDADIGPVEEPVSTVVGQVSGGALTSSTNYTMRVVVGGGPMATTQSTNYELSVGFGALANQ